MGVYMGMGVISIWALFQYGRYFNMGVITGEYGNPVCESAQCEPATNSTWNVCSHGVAVNPKAWRAFHFKK